MNKNVLLIAAASIAGLCFMCTVGVYLFGLGGEDGDSRAEQTTAPVAPNAAADSLEGKLIGTWNRKASRGCPLTDVACIATDPGVTRHWYTFADDGTYTFEAQYLPNYSDSLYFQDEKGSWSLEGDQLTLTPEESTWRRHGLNNGSRKPGGPLKDEGENPLDVVTYRVRFHLFEGIGETDLILTTNGEPTRRDHTFAVHPDFPFSYILSPGR
ncbi:MAG: lipocalin family protein [Archangium sp.]|nr:lipocalin family protein [Archangium sp.]